MTRFLKAIAVAATLAVELDAHQHVGARPPGKGSLIHLLRRAGRAALDPRC